MPMSCRGGLLILGIVTRSESIWSEAKGVLIAAINSSPNFAAAHFELGVALRQQGKPKEAQAEFQKAATLDPNLKPPATKKN